MAASMRVFPCPQFQLGRTEVMEEEKAKEREWREEKARD
jgi:hypothetical protein